MQEEEIFLELQEISKNNEILKNDLVIILKKFSKTISVFDLMIATALLKDENKYVQVQYLDRFLEAYIKYPLQKIKQIKEESNIYMEDDIIDKNDFIESITLLETQSKRDRDKKMEESKVPLIHLLCSLYATFILEEPIHPVGTGFPGNLEVEEIDGIYYCPVKEKQNDNPNAVCKLCLAEQTNF